MFKMNQNIQKPNILLILLDSLRADRLSCYGYHRNTSPHIDRVAENSLLFENAIVSAPWTLPSHASLFTGRYPIEHGATEENLHLASHHHTLAELLQKMGYQTIAHSRDNGWLSTSTNLMKGFENLFDFTRAKKVEKPSVLLTMKRKAKSAFHIKGTTSSEQTIKTIESYFKHKPVTGKPWFVFVNLMDTHMPYCPSPKFIRQFGLGQASPTDIEYLQKNFKEYRSHPESVSQSHLKLLNILYDACIATVDRALARLLKIVTSRPHNDNTLLIITSDHGECLGEHGLLNHWLSVNDVLLKVPLILFYPSGISSPKRIQPQIQQHDLFYTILDAIHYNGTEIKPDLISARSLLSAIEGKVPFPEYTYAEHAYPKMNLEHIRKYNPSFQNGKLVCAKQAIRSNEFKFINYESGLEELFDLNNDPGETKSVLDQNQTETTRLKNQLKKMRSELQKAAPSATPQQEFDEITKTKLQDLGYL